VGSRTPAGTTTNGPPTQLRLCDDLCSTKTGSEAGVRGVDVEHPELARAGVPEPVNDADWRGNVGSRASNYGPTADDELGRALAACPLRLVPVRATIG